MITTRISGDTLVAKLQRVCRVIDSQYSRAVDADICALGPLRALKRAAPDPLDYSEPVDFARDWMVYNSIRKLESLPGSKAKERAATALRGWEAAEKKCLSTNGRIDAFERGHASILGELIPGVTETTYASVIMRAQKKISSVLGPFNKKKALAECRWSGGATYDHGRGTPLSVKMTSVISVSAQALPHLRWVLSRDVHWTASILGVEPVGYASLLDGWFTICNETRHELVPKTAYVDRSIGIEPTGNAFLQQGVGRYIRRRLKRVSVDLDDQSKAQSMAAEAFIESLATLDLESASDTVSRKLVHLLLPLPWFRFLDQLRTPLTRLKDGRLVLLSKFSSMGNAFTFELESLIFWALSSAVVELTCDESRHGRVSVYGDDIIVPREAACGVIQVLNLLGFATNESKTFLRGPFFESCGKHYFQGTDVTPFYQASRVIGEHEVIRFWNRVVRWNYRITGSVFCEYTGPWLKDVHMQFKQPLCLEGDLAACVPLNELGSLPYDRNKGYLIRGIAECPVDADLPRQDAAYAYKLRRPTTMNSSPKGYAVTEVREDSGGFGRKRLIRLKRWVSGDSYEPV